MLELLFCSMLTILPDFLVRRFVQGKRIGKEITLYSVWYELRYGIVTCLMLTVGLITVIFYNHPSTTNTTAFFRTVPIMAESVGKVDQVFVNLQQDVKAGDPLFHIESADEQTALVTAQQRVAEVDAAIKLATVDLATADAKVAEAQSNYTQAKQELDTRVTLQERNSGTISVREIERLQNVLDGRDAAVAAAQSARLSAETKVETTLPAERATAVATVEQAQASLDKTTIYAGVSGRVEQFTLRVGDLVNPITRTAGILIPDAAGRVALQAGFDQIEAQIMKPGMTAEVVCFSNPFRVTPMVVSTVQNFIASGQFQLTDRLIDPSNAPAPGTMLVFLEPMFTGGLDDVPPGSSCIAAAYSDYHEQLLDPNLGTGTRIWMHAVDTVGLVQALLLRIKAIMIPIQTLVLSGH